MINSRNSSGKALSTKPGQPFPLGGTLTGEGVQFSLFSRHATSVSLLLFDKADDDNVAHCIILDSKINKTGDCWHIVVEGIAEGQLYLFQVDGPYKQEQGFLFNKEMFLIDPYCKAVTGMSGEATRRPKCVIVDDAFDWQGDVPLNYPLWKTVIYETHVKGFTKHPNTVKRFGLNHSGTFAGMVEMIPYLKELGITSVELLPIAEFDENEYVNSVIPSTGRPKTNYWGYSTVAFFALKESYTASGGGFEQVREFKTMVRELHKAGIEVILDIVFNHTGEGNHRGPTLSFRGLDNTIYYILEQDKRFYMNYSGCGNTVNCNHPVVRNLIIDCLRYWVQEMHVDGFRFDLASVLTRDGLGKIMDNPPILECIVEDVVLRNTKIIAEPWDAGGAYQVGCFYSRRWAEWNDKFRNDVRAFWRGDPGMISAFATRVSGSSDLYSSSGRKPYHSINYITAHDGFTLLDLVSYNEKHNGDNGENNQDGTDFNLGYNWGAEGETDNESILKMRSRMIKNFLATLFISSGTPMILGGDEFRRTQYGNNNAYCQDNELSWYDFSRIDRYPDTHRFARLIIEFRKNHRALQRREFFVGRDKNSNNVPDIEWFDENGDALDWSRNENILALRIDGKHEETHHSKDDVDFIMYFNSTDGEVSFSIPKPLPGYGWFRSVDTALESPDDIVEHGREVPVETGYTVDRRSMVILIEKSFP